MKHVTVIKDLIEIIVRQRRALKECKRYIESIIDEELYGDNDNSNIDLLDTVEECLIEAKKE